ncbi:hypothetical protein L2750_16240 [Shewanella submarina]|uniref:Uncharacterized protein n=1 Tax=Shewanella submarina TaxID=2016376 RepID=A0ABV7GCB9_9GAMM|nr:hypothetical protein [Shewanella submarina]MCL1038679.1 hypothetical protein [Shewanella submarina]
MKSISKVLAGSLLLAAALPAAATDRNPGVQCVDGQYISQIDFGYITNIQGGPDWANAVVVHFANGTVLPVNVHYNHNDAGGRNIIEALRMAFTTRSPVSVWDHDHNNCDDFDMVRVVSSTF